MPDLLFVCVFLAAWVFMSCLAKEVFKGNRGLTLAGIGMGSLAALYFASFVSGSVQAVGNALSDPFGVLRMAQVAMFYVFVAGILAVVGVFVFFAGARALKEIPLWIKVWKVRAILKEGQKYIDKADRLAEMGESDRALALLEKAKGYSDKAKRVMGVDRPEPQRGKQKKAGTAKRRRLKKKTVRRKKKGFVEWTNEG